MNSLNPERLNVAIEESGMTLTALAKKLSISRESLYNKINRKTEFTASEIGKMSSALHLTNEARDAIFFGN